jgi:hypothetical protein
LFLVLLGIHHQERESEELQPGVRAAIAEGA